MSIGAFVLFVSVLATPADASDRTLELHCPGLEDFEIRVVQGVDAGFGTIRTKDTAHTIAISLGMVAEHAPLRRPAGFRWYKSEAIGNVTLTYGMKPKTKTVEATILGAPVSSLMNLTGAVEAQEMLLDVARMLSTSKCTWVEIEP